MKTIELSPGVTIKAPDFEKGNLFANWNASGTVNDFVCYKVVAVSRVQYLNGTFRFFMYDVEVLYHTPDRDVRDRRFYKEKEFHAILAAHHCHRA